jgi:hypothetical protein
MPRFAAGMMQFKVQQEGVEWSLVTENIRSEEDLEIAREALKDALPKLGFEVRGDLPAESGSTLAVPAIAPVRRYWDGRSLAVVDVLLPTARIELHTKKKPPEVRWEQDDFPGAAAVVGQPAVAIEVNGAVIVRRSSIPAITPAYERSTWDEANAELAIEGILNFEDLPSFPQGIAGTVSVDGGADNFPLIFDPETRKFRTTVRLGDDHPRSIQLRFTWDAKWDGNSLTSENELVMPVAFGEAEFLTAEGTYAASIFLGLPPEFVRFAKHEYLPDKIDLQFRFRTYEWQCSALHESGTAAPAVYKIDWVGDALDTFRRAAPGEILMSVAGESTPRRVLLFPGLVRGVWTDRDGRQAFRITSTGIDERPITNLLSAANAEKIQATIVDGTILPEKPIAFASHVVFKDGTIVPLDPGGFKPLFLSDPGILWKSKPKRATLIGAEPNAPGAATLLRASGASALDHEVTPATIPLARLQDLGTAPAIFQFGDAALQMLIYRTGAGKFGGEIEESAVPGAGAVGLYFRGFYFNVKLIDADGPLAPGGKLLLLDTPLSLSFAALSSHLLAFSPLRAAFDPKRSVVNIFAGGRQIALSADDAGIVSKADPSAFSHLGYIYGPSADATWSPVAAKEVPWLYTYDNLVFALTEDEAVTFNGWFLPNGSAVFPAQPPFSAYGFHFSTSGAVASAVLDPLPLRVARWESKLTDIENAAFDEFEAKIGIKLNEIAVDATSHQQISEQSFSITTDDGRQYEISIQLDQASHSLRLVVAPPASAPAVRFFSLT